MIVGRSIVPAASTDMQEARVIPFACMFRLEGRGSMKWYRPRYDHPTPTTQTVAHRIMEEIRLERLHPDFLKRAKARGLPLARLRQEIGRHESIQHLSQI